MQTAGIMANLHKPSSIAVADKLIKSLAKHDIRPVLDPALASKLHMPEFSGNDLYEKEFLFVIGGDGTIISQAIYLAEAGLQTPIVGINTGRVGFLADIEAADIDRRVQDISNGNFRIEKRSVLQMEIQGEKQKYFALNEFGIVRKQRPHVIELELSIDEYPVERYLCDGILVSTPTGSTAYSFSAGGPIINPEVKCAVIVPICAYSINPRPIVIGSNSIIRVAARDKTDNTMLTADGKTVADLQYKNSVVIKSIDDSIGFIKFHNDNYFNRFEKKLLKLQP
jgi:NAD+ kinase